MTNLTPRVPEVGVLAKDETHGEDFRDELEGEDIQVQPLTYLYKRSLECLCGSVRERVREGGGVGVGRETGCGEGGVSMYQSPGGSSGDAQAIVRQLATMVSSMMGSNHQDSAIWIASLRGKWAGSRQQSDCSE